MRSGSAQSPRGKKVLGKGYPALLRFPSTDKDEPGPWGKPRGLVVSTPMPWDERRPRVVGEAYFGRALAGILLARHVNMAYLTNRRLLSVWCYGRLHDHSA